MITMDEMQDQVWEDIQEERVNEASRIETLRECIERGGRGDFAKALLELYDSPLDHFDRAYRIADSANQEALEAVERRANSLWWDGYSETDAMKTALRECFPGLCKLDELCDNPHEIPLRGEG